MTEETAEPTTAPAEPVAAVEPGPVPYDRFKQVNDKFKASQAELDALRGQQADKEKAQLIEQQNFKDLAEKLQADLDAQTAATSAAELARLRLQVATDAGLPAEMAARLVGTTAEELATDAGQLASWAKPAAPGVPGVNGKAAGPGAITASQLTDPAWVRKNKQRILAARK